MPIIELLYQWFGDLFGFLMVLVVLSGFLVLWVIGNLIQQWRHKNESVK
jgi:hypothetical protein